MEFELEKREVKTPIIRFVSQNIDATLELRDDDDVEIAQMILDRITTSSEGK